jgi:GNAT superfamily N-acetyltransferase
MPEPTFRQAIEADAEAIAAVGEQIWDELGEGSGLPQRPTADGIAALFASDRGGVFVCEVQGAICGFAVLSPDPTAGSEQTPPDATEAVMGVWLLPSARRKGVGRELALMATDFARATGYKKLRGTLPAGNEQALSFFSDIGSLAQMVGQGMQYELPL